MPLSPNKKNSPAVISVLNLEREWRAVSTWTFNVWVLPSKSTFRETPTSTQISEGYSTETIRRPWVYVSARINWTTSTLRRLLKKPLRFPSTQAWATLKGTWIHSRYRGASFSLPWAILLFNHRQGSQWTSWFQRLTRPRTRLTELTDRWLPTRSLELDMITPPYQWNWAKETFSMLPKNNETLCSTLLTRLMNSS